VIYIDNFKEQDNITLQEVSTTLQNIEHNGRFDIKSGHIHPDRNIHIQVHDQSNSESGK
jgi:hypothetical protein